MADKAEGSGDGAQYKQVPAKFLCLKKVFAELEKDMLVVESGAKDYAEIEQRIAEIHQKIAQMAVQGLKKRLNRERCADDGSSTCMHSFDPAFRRVFEALAASLEGVASDGSTVDYAAFEHLVAPRMKRPGARWKNATGEDVLHLRARVLSDRWA